LWTFRVDEGVEALYRLAKATERQDYIEPGGFVPETLVAGCPWGSNPGNSLGWAQACLLPFLADRLIESRSTIHGNAFYAIRDSRIVPKRAALRRLVIELVGPDGQEAFDEDLVSYDNEFRLVLDRIRSDSKRRVEIGPPPLPIGKPLASGRDENDVGALKPLFDGPV
jgi:hypothetical protein